MIAKTTLRKYPAFEQRFSSAQKYIANERRAVVPVG